MNNVEKSQMDFAYDTSRKLNVYGSSWILKTSTMHLKSKLAWYLLITTINN